MEFRRSFFPDETRPDPTNYINYSSTFKSLKAVKDVVSVEVWEYVEKSPLGIIIKFMDLEFAWSSTLVHYVFSRQLYCKKRHELWFLIEKQPARFSLFEFEDITGLNCEPLPNTMVVEDVEKSISFWALFHLRCTRSTPGAEDIRTLSRSPDVCRSWSREDQIRLCYLAILTGGLLALDRREAIPPSKAKLLMDLEIFEQYPWGRVAVIKYTTAKKIKDNSYVCKGFVQVIQVWAYAYIPCLGEAIGHPIGSSGPCLLRFKVKFGKLPLGAILEKPKVTSMCPRSVDEVHPVWEHQDEDPVIDNLLEFLRQDNSLSTITWQPLPEYPLTPIECNKQTEEQVQSHDVLMSPRNLYQLLSEKVEVWEEQFNSVPVSAVFQSAGGITIDNLASRITQQEEIMLVITTAHDQFSNTKLPAKPATPAVLQGADGHHDQGKEVDKEDGKLVREDHPDNPEEENAVEDMEEELPFEVEGKDVGETALQTKREDHADNREKENPGEEAVEEQGNEESQPKSQGFCLSNCSLTSASKFFNVFLTKREWLDDEVGDLTFDTYLGVPRATSPYGDCGVYVLKFLECLMMGVELKSNFLNDGNMGLVRENLAAEMYVETASANANMWDPEFVTKAIDEAIPVE
ncbi:unnamed protein product [Brassica rapa]|uniref:DUF1985 domain-containing protein n=2 Tax=Brassica TaxID=3705 RepID=A0A8D9H7S0_BRACM|nr:unnamed protein product [Brassica napus]CAG7894480.1 unnamed protein product [Brassica rapa]